MEVGAIIVCRLDSKRLPGKVLRTARGKPLLWYIISRCQELKTLADSIIVATSARKIDDAIADYCRQENVIVFRGSSDNVANRIIKCSIEHNLEYFIRINADSPFLEPSLINRACDVATSSDYEIVTNLYPRTFPYGVSVELVRTDVFQAAYEQMSTPEHFEHVTLFFYQNMERFRYYNITRGGDNLSKIRLTVDTEQDWQIFERVVNKVGERWKSISYLDAVELYRKEA
jgi:spore coat polysaccharide biosynthesis protein SpsF (cytidylyltransferase family)